MAVPNGTGLASSGVPTLPERVGGSNAKNSRPAKGGLNRCSDGPGDQEWDDSVKSWRASWHDKHDTQAVD